MSPKDAEPNRLPRVLDAPKKSQVVPVSVPLKVVAPVTLSVVPVEMLPADRAPETAAVPFINVLLVLEPRVTCPLAINVPATDSDAL